MVNRHFTKEDFVNDFIYIIKKGKKDNTYKFALAKFLIDYAIKVEDLQLKLDNNTNYIIEYSTIAREFLRYYWHQIIKYKIRQNYNIEKSPLIVQILKSIFANEKTFQSYKDISEETKLTAENQIAKKCFSEVIPRFQNIGEGNKVISKKTFYEYYYENENKIEVYPQAIKFFKENSIFLNEAVILEWARFLEKINPGLPELISKIEGIIPQRSSLEKYRIILSKYFQNCFYCEDPLNIENKKLVHVDHVIPWSYIYEDELWNLVLACEKCNRKKYNSLPLDNFLKKLIDRNLRFININNIFKKSILKLDLIENHEKAIKKHYQNCRDYGFTMMVKS